MSDSKQEFRKETKKLICYGSPNDKFKMAVLRWLFKIEELEIKNPKLMINIVKKDKN